MAVGEKIFCQAVSFTGFYVKIAYLISACRVSRIICAYILHKYTKHKLFGLSRCERFANTEVGYYRFEIQTSFVVSCVV